MGELSKRGSWTVSDAFGDGAPVTLAKGQPRHAEEAPSGSIVRVRRDEDGYRVDEVLAERGSPLAKMYAIAAENHVDPVFPPAVEAEVEALLADPGIDDPSLVDHTSLPFVTIDGPGTRDLDQAVFLERHGDGWLVWYALADPSWCVRPGSALFDEALRRGASYYLPGLAIPMLPRPLSEGVVSLNAEQDRRAVVFRMVVARDGRCLETDILRARVRSRAQLTFAEVQSFLDDPRKNPLSAREAEESIALLPEVGEARLEDAAGREVAHYRRSETEVKLEGGIHGRFVIDLGMRSQVERYNEQLSLLCNVEGALFLKRGDRPDDQVQPIYRVHPKPAPERIEELETMIDALCRRHDLDRDRWCWRRGGKLSLARFLDELPKEGAQGRIAQAIHRQAVLTNVRSLFSEEPAGHHGVGAEVYARFSAPMREVVGVFLHKETFEQLGQPPAPRPAGSPDDDTLRQLIVDKANESKELQKRLTKEANRVVLDDLFEADRRMKREQRPERRGTVMGMSRGKVHVMLDEPTIEVKLYREHLEEQLGGEVLLSEDGAQLERGGQVVLRVGDAVTVRVHDRDSRRDRWALTLIR